METKRYRIIKSFTALIFAAALALTGAVPSFAAERNLNGTGDTPDTSATSVMVMDAGSGDILYEKDAHKKRDPASITKVLNLLVCLDTLDFDQEVTVKIEPESEGSIMELKKGEKIRIGDIAYGMMLWSANDGAEYMGYLAGNGDMDAFCEMMNAKAKELGAKDTKYVNPNGLNGEAVNNITTAYDTAVIVRAAMKDKRFRKIVSTTRYTIPATNKSKARKLTNSNRCLWDEDIRAAAKGDKEALDKYAAEYKSNPYNYIDEETDDALVRELAQNQAKAVSKLMYKPCIGVKTGYSSTAGDCFAGFAKQGNTEIIVVVLNSAHTKTKFQDAKKLWTYAYDNFKSYTAQKAGDFEYELKVKRGSLREVEVGISEDLKVTALKKEKPSETVTTEIELKEEKPMAPLKKGTVVGRLVAYDDGEEIGSQNLIALETAKKGGPLSYIGIADEDVPKFIIVVVLVLIVLIIVIWLIRASRRNAARRRKRAKRRAAEKRAEERKNNGRPGKY